MENIMMSISLLEFAHNNAKHADLGKLSPFLQRVEKKRHLA